MKINLFKNYFYRENILLLSSDDLPLVLFTDSNHVIFKKYEEIKQEDDFSTLIKNNIIDRIIFTLNTGSPDKIRKIIKYSIWSGKKISLYNPKKNKLIDISPIRTKKSYLIFKRCLDLLGAFLLIFLSLPIMAIVALLIKVTSTGKIFFKQTRVGLNGRTFTLYKFRTMVENAESIQASLNTANIIQGPAFKIKNDPRITKLGSFLRKSSLDELPQLFNILKGEMSLVGPRPPIPAETKEYKLWHLKRISVKPGLTGLWQVSGRNEILDFNKWVNLDINYIENMNSQNDLKILTKTVNVVLKSVGAH